MATQGSGFFSNFFGGGSGGIEHAGGGKTTALPAASPQQQLSHGAAPAAAPTPEPEVNPLDSHLADMANVWKTATTADGKPIAPQADPLAQSMLNFKQEDVVEAAKKLDFTASLNPELAGKALGGDPAALIELIDGAVRGAFVASTINTGHMVNQTFDKYGKAIDQALPSRFRQHAIANSHSEDPVLSHPAIAPVVQAMKATIAAQQPQMTPAQVQLAAENYVKGMGTAFNLKEEKVVQQQVAKEEVDWMKWANMGQ